MKELGTDLSQKFRRDIFLSTRAKIILFHTFSTAVVVFVVLELIGYIQQETLSAVVESVKTMLATGNADTDIFGGASERMREVKFYVFAAIILASLVFAIIATRIALHPVREALIMQKRFISSVAHELRTPLAVLKTQNEVALLDATPGTQTAETFRENIEEIDHITAILNNLLLFNRVDTFESIKFDQVDITTIIEAVVTRLSEVARKKGVVLQSDETVVPHVYGNATALEQALFNITKNAIDYTKRGGMVNIKCTAITEREVTISVIDTGIGIERKHLRHIFEPFFRTDAGRDISRGSGLGLAIVFEIVKLHNGKIMVESIPSEGTTIQLVLPRRPRSAERETRAEDGRIQYDFSQLTKT